MTYLYSEPNLTSGIDDAIVSTAQSVTIFPIMVLFFVFFVILIGGSANQKRRIGVADYPFWAVLSSVTTFFVALIFTLRSGIINSLTLGIVVAVTIMSALWFFISKTRGEQ